MPQQYTVHVHDASGIAEQLLPGYSPREPKQYSLEADVARAAADDVLNSHQATRSLTPDIRIPAADYIQDAIRTAATEAHEDVYHFMYNRIRDHPRVGRVADYRDSHPNPSTPAHSAAHRSAVQALGSAASTSNLPPEIRPQMEAYVREAIDNATDRSHQVVLAWWSGKSDEQVAGVDDFNARVEAHRAQDVLSASPPAHLATHRSSGSAQATSTTSAAKNLRTPGAHQLGGA